MKHFFCDKSIIFLWIFGFFLGVILTCLKKDIFLSEAGFLAGYSLSPLQYGEINRNALFLYLLRHRFLSLLFFFVIGTTYLGSAVLMGGCMYQGVSKGVFFAVGIMKYGFPGFLLFFISFFPHIFFLIPGYYLFWSEGIKMCRAIYYKPELRHGRKSFLSYVLRFAYIVLCIMIGCILEGYISPFLIRWILGCVF